MDDALDGYVMEPMPVVGDEVASVISGHDFIQALNEEEQAYFHSFVKEVLFSYGIPVRRN